MPSFSCLSAALTVITSRADGRTAGRTATAPPRGVGGARRPAYSLLPPLPSLAFLVLPSFWPKTMPRGKVFRACDQIPSPRLEIVSGISGNHGFDKYSSYSYRYCCLCEKGK